MAILSSTEILTKATTRILPLRFIWFTIKSWSYLQGDRSNYFKGFCAAWHRFNRSVKHDLKCQGCCGDD